MEYGFWSIVPPLVTIALALAIKNVFIALIIGIFLASWILADFHLFTGINDTFYSLVHTFEEQQQHHCPHVHAAHWRPHLSH